MEDSTFQAQSLVLAQKELRQSEERYRRLVDSIRDYAIFALDSDGRVVSWNRGAERIKQYRADEIVGQSFAKFYTPEDLAKEKPAFELKEAVAQGRFEDEGWRVKKDGTRFWANVIITPIWDEGHRLLGFSKVTRDMTDKKNIEVALQNSYEELEDRVKKRTAELEQTKERLELALDAAQMGTWDWDLITGEVLWSKNLKKLYGYLDGEVPVRNQGISERVHPWDRQRVSELAQKAIRDRTIHSVEYRVLWPNGEIHWISVQGRASYDSRGTAVRMAGTAIGIDERKRSQAELEELVRQRTDELSHAQAALVQSAKMSALGEMAGGIAHEINTPLAAITMKAQQLERRAEKTSEVPLELIKRETHLIAETAKRIGVIISGLRTFARNGDQDPFVPMTTNQMVENVLTLCRNRFENHGIHIRYAPTASPLTFECRAVPIEQVLLNLLSNSFDAIQNLPEKWIQIDVQDEGNYVAFQVTDSGPGIQPEIVAKIMQPFFTTKAVGKGTGLGLSISKGIVEDHHGYIGVDTTSDRTRFVVRLPKQAPPLPGDGQ